MNIVRETLVGEKQLTVLATYSNIGLHTGNSFVDEVAKKELMDRRDLVRKEVNMIPDPERPGQILHCVTLFDNANVAAVRFYGVWPSVDESEQDEPDTLLVQ